VLWQRLGELTRDKIEDHCKAAEFLEKAATLPNASPVLPRFAAYELAKCPGHERAAYEKLRALYDKGGAERAPTLIRVLKNLEEKLGIPPSERIQENSPP
jgi:DNA-binding SARP family transcriptional activator